MESQGVIYILTNPSFPDFVKIGYADDINRRLNQLNRSECVPFAFRVYATYEVSSRLSDTKIHSIIDKLNPNLRSIENFNGKRRVREFYAMKPTEAYAILEAIADINGCRGKLRLIEPSESEKQEENLAIEVKKEVKTRNSPFSFSACGIPVGAELEFWSSAYQPTGIICKVVDDRHVMYESEIYSLTGLAKKLTHTSKALNGTIYYKYNGSWLNEIRRRMGYSIPYRKNR